MIMAEEIKLINRAVVLNSSLSVKRELTQAICLDCKELP